MIRQDLFELLSTDEWLAEQAEGGIHSAGAVSEEPASKRFVVIRFGGVTPGAPGARASSGIVPVEIYVHDTRGTYVWIDEVIQHIKALLDSTVHYRGIAQVTWESDSTDLYDDGHRTNNKFTRHRLIGRGF